MKRYYLKKTILSLIVFLVFTVCTACGDTDSEPADKGITKGAKPTKAATENTGKKDDETDPDKDDDKQDDDNKQGAGNHAETHDNYYYLLNYYDDNVLYGYIEDGQFVFWPGLWVSFGDDYVQYNWQYINQNAYSSRPGDSPSGATRITVYSDGGQDDWGSYEVIYSEDVVKLRSSDAEGGEYLVFINSKLIDYKGDICAQIKAITGLDMKMPVDE